jgi:sterol desaturase/sphingolipid hydroxylase (fatty acid hydroxylase superfamily)
MSLTAARLHPLDETLDTLLISVPLLLVGVPLGVFAALGPFFLLHTLLVHADVDWSFGPLGRVLASPRFHRRHHARDLPAANYGGVFAFYDVLFGTFEMPAADPGPGAFGITERDVPESVLGQMVYPVRRLLR